MSAEQLVESIIEQVLRLAAEKSAECPGAALRNTGRRKRRPGASRTKNAEKINQL